MFQNVKEKLTLSPDTLDDQSVYKIMAGCIVPRPIGFITTISKEGNRNAAPFSFFNMISHMPPLVCISISYDNARGKKKDTLQNIEDTREFVVNIVNRNLSEAQDLCSGTFASDVDEIKLSGLNTEDSCMVRPPRILESPANFECRAVEILKLPESTHTLVIGKIVAMHIARSILLPGYKIDHHALDAVGRMAGNAYCTTRDRFTHDHDTFKELADLKKK